MTNHEQPVQMRLGFAAPTRPLRLDLVLSGLYVLVDAPSGLLDEAFAYLSAAGAWPEITEDVELRIPVARLKALSELPAQVRLAPDERLEPLLRLVLHPSTDGLPATLVRAASGHLMLRWHDGVESYEELFDPRAATALLHAGLPFEATHEAWQTLHDACVVPLVHGTARLNLDGFIEIATATPQMVEAATLPGLFRLDETHFGVALAYGKHVTASPSFKWDGTEPEFDMPPHAMPGLPIELSEHAQHDLRSFVDRLAAHRAQVLVWESGLGRRIFALAAIEALDSWPLVVVTPPAHLWAWQRHLDLMRRTHSLQDASCDALILTYNDLAAGRPVPSPGTLIFDDLPQVFEDEARIEQGLLRLDGVRDAYRMVISSVWPEDPAAAVRLMSALRPSEFRRDVSLVQRYPMQPRQRALEHVGAYLNVKHVTDDDARDSAFRRSRVQQLDPTEAQEIAMHEIRARTEDSQRKLVSLAAVTSYGTEHALSPKIAAAVAAVRSAMSQGRRIAVCTRNSTTADLIAAAARPLAVTRGVDPSGSASIVLYEDQLPDVTAYAEVLLVDYPRSMLAVEQAAGSAELVQGPQNITVLHLRDSIDERLAVVAALRRSNGTGCDEYTDAEVRYLLG